MRIKFFTVILLLVGLAVAMQSCVEEPTIPEVKYPYTMLRVGNFSSNVDNFKVYIDDELKGSVSKGNVLNYTGPGMEQSGYMKIVTGSRTVKLTDPSDNTLFEKSIELTSYGESTVSFGGYFSTDALETSFFQEQYLEGYVHLEEGNPLIDSARVYLVNYLAFSPLSPDSLIRFNMELVDLNPANARDTVIALTDALAPSNANATLAAGDYRLFVTSTSDATVMDSTDVTVVSGMRQYIWCYGHALDMQFKVDDTIKPLPVLEK